MHGIAPRNIIRQALALLLVAGVIATTMPPAYAVTEDAADTHQEAAPAAAPADTEAQSAPAEAEAKTDTAPAATTPAATAAAAPLTRFTTETVAATATTPAACVWRLPSLRDQTAEIQMAVVLGGGAAPELLLLLEGAMSLDGVVMMIAFSEAQLVNNRIFDSTGAQMKQEKGAPLAIQLPLSSLDALIAALGTPGATLHYVGNDAARGVLPLPSADAADVTAFKACAAPLIAAAPPPTRSPQ